MSSREYRGERVVLWPVNIDSEATIREGRKIPRAAAVPRPRLEEIVKAALNLGLEPVVEEKSYPRRWYEQNRRVSVLKMQSKRRTLLAIALEIRRLRRERARE